MFVGEEIVLVEGEREDGLGIKLAKGGIVLVVKEERGEG